MAILENRKASLKPTVKPSRALDLETAIPSIKSFEETYKTSYSHGLEDIYALENIDIKSVRKIGEIKKPPTKPVEPVLPKIAHRPQQLPLPLGNEHTGTISSFFSREPIQVLNLSKQAEKCLQEKGKLLLQDLIDINVQDLIFSKGMGQGHIDEINTKLKQYVNNRVVDHCETIDFASWILSLTAALERKKSYVLLKQFHLEELLSLSPAESVEVNRLVEEKKSAWSKEMQAILQTDNRINTVRSDMKSVVNAFIKPWMRRRLFLATSSELLERMEKVSDQTALAIHALNFFNACYFNGQSAIEQYLYRLDVDLYCSEKFVADLYALAIKTAKTYFYKPTLTYSLGHLIALIETECAKQWLAFPEGFLEKALSHSSHFRVKKLQGTLHISLA